MILKNVIKFLQDNNWELVEKHQIFSHYKTPKGLGVPKEFYLEIPSKELSGFDHYIEGIINILSDLYIEYTIEDFNIIFASEKYLDEENTYLKVSPSGDPNNYCVVKLDQAIEELKTIMKDPEYKGYGFTSINMTFNQYNNLPEYTGF